MYTRVYLRSGEREAAPDGGPDELCRSHTSRSPPVVAEIRLVERFEVAIHSLQKMQVRKGVCVGYVFGVMYGCGGENLTEFPC